MWGCPCSEGRKLRLLPPILEEREGRGASRLNARVLVPHPCPRSQAPSLVMLRTNPQRCQGAWNAEGHDQSPGHSQSGSLVLKQQLASDSETGHHEIGVWAQPWLTVRPDWWAPGCTPGPHNLSMLFRQPHVLEMKRTWQWYDQYAGPQSSWDWDPGFQGRASVSAAKTRSVLGHWDWTRMTQRILLGLDPPSPLSHEDRETPKHSDTL